MSFGVSADPKLGFQGLIERVEQLKKKDPDMYVLDQLSNPANPEAHFTSTGNYLFNLFLWL